MLAPMMYSGSRIHANAAQFGTGDGSATAFQLKDRHGHNVTSQIKLASIHQADWQGRVELSDQPRTNYALNSDDPSTWNPVRVTLEANAATAPNGSQTACKVICTGATDPYVTRTGAAKFGDTKTWSVWAWTDAGQPTEATVFIYGSGTTDTAYKGIILTTTPTRYDITTTITQAATTGVTARLDLQHAPTAGVYAYCWGGQIEDGDKPGAYIPTTDSAVTVTDYTHDGQGVITTGQVPADDAVLDWTGTGRRAA